jgi:hypothetical protein
VEGCFKFTLAIQKPGVKKSIIIDPKIRNVPMEWRRFGLILGGLPWPPQECARRGLERQVRQPLLPLADSLPLRISQGLPVSSWCDNRAREAWCR